MRNDVVMERRVGCFGFGVIDNWGDEGLTGQVDV